MSYIKVVTTSILLAGTILVHPILADDDDHFVPSLVINQTLLNDPALNPNIDEVAITVYHSVALKDFREHDDKIPTLWSIVRYSTASESNSFQQLYNLTGETPVNTGGPAHRGTTDVSLSYSSGLGGLSDDSYAVSAGAIAGTKRVKKGQDLSIVMQPLIEVLLAFDFSAYPSDDDDDDETEFKEFGEIEIKVDIKNGVATVKKFKIEFKRHEDAEDAFAAANQVLIEQITTQLEASTTQKSEWEMKIEVIAPFEDVTSITLDRVPPEVVIVTPASAPTNNNIAALNILWSDTGSGIDILSAAITLNGDDITSLLTVDANGASGFVPLGADGIQTIDVQIADNAGNVAQDDVVFTLDTTAPLITGSDPAMGAILGIDSTFFITITHQEPGTGIGSIEVLMTINDPAFATVFTDITDDFAVTPTSSYTYISVTDPISNGIIEITYTATDLVGNISSAFSFGFTVDTNTPPVALNQSISTISGLPVIGNLTVTDAEGDDLTFQIVDQPLSGGFAVVNPQSGAFTFFPDENFIGNVEFTFRANDGQSHSNIATVFVDVAPSAIPSPLFSSPAITFDTTINQYRANYVPFEKDGELYNDLDGIVPGLIFVSPDTDPTVIAVDGTIIPADGINNINVGLVRDKTTGARITIYSGLTAQQMESSFSAFVTIDTVIENFFLANGYGFDYSINQFVTPPDTFITSGPTNGITDGAAIFEFHANDPGAIFECKLFAESMYDFCASPFTVTNALDGANIFQVRAIGIAGGVDPTPAEFLWAQGVSPNSVNPSTQFTVPALYYDSILQGYRTNLSPFEFEGRQYWEPGSPFLFFFPEGANPEMPTPEGPNLAVIASDAQAVDADGEDNFDVVLATIIDGQLLTVFGNTDPPILLTNFPFIVTQTIVLEHYFIANGYGFDYSINQGAPTDTAIQSGPGNGSTDTVVSFVFSSPDPMAAFECRLDNSSVGWTACNSPHQETINSAQKHTLRVRSVTLLGDIDPTPAEYTWQSVVEPETTIETTPPLLTNAESATFTFSSSDSPGLFECALDGVAFSTCTSPIVYTGLSPTVHIFEVRATNLFQLVDQSPASHTWEITNEQPVAFDANFDVREGLIFAGSLIATDPEDNILTFELVDAPVTGVLDLQTDGSFSYEANEETDGQIDTFTFRVTDGNGYSNIAMVTLTIGPLSPPSLLFATDVTSRIIADEFSGTELDDQWFTFSFTTEVTGPSDVAQNAQFQNFVSVSNGLLEFDGGLVDPSQVTNESRTMLVFSDDAFEPQSFSISLEYQILPSSTGKSTYQFLMFNFEDVFGEAMTPENAFLVLQIFVDARNTESDGFTGLVGTNGDINTVNGGTLGFPFFTAPPVTFGTRIMVDFTYNLDQKTLSVSIPSFGQLYTFVNVEFDRPMRTAIFAASDGSGEFGAPEVTTHTRIGVDYFRSSLASSNIGFVTSLSPLEVDGVAYTDGLEPDQGPAVVFVPDFPETLIGKAKIIQDDDIDIQVDGLDNLHAAAVRFVDGRKTTLLTGLSESEIPVFLPGLVSVDAYFPDYFIANGTATDYTLNPYVPVPDTGINNNIEPIHYTNQNQITLGFSDNDSGLGFSFECLSNTFTDTYLPCPGLNQFSLPLTTDGIHFVHARAVGLDGHVDPTPYKQTVIRDTTPFQLVGMPPLQQPPSPNTGTTATWDWHVTTYFPPGIPAANLPFDQAPVTAFLCSFDGSNFTACEPPVTYTGLGKGQHDLSVLSIDAAGNTVTQTNQFFTFVDLPPISTIFSGPDEITTDNSATFTFTADDVGTSFVCNLDDIDVGPCTSPKTYNLLVTGMHTFTVTGTDPLGQQDVTPPTHSWAFVDLVPPETIMTAQDVDEGVHSPATQVTFSFDTNEVATFECRLDGSVYSTCVSPVTVTVLIEEEHTFEVRAVDAAMLVDPFPETVSWFLDFRPETIILSGPPAFTGNNSPIFTFTANEPATFRCKLDIGGFQTCSSPKTYSGLALGPHTVQIQAQDTFGQLDLSPAPHSWTQVIPPDTFIGAQPSEITSDNFASVEFSSNDVTATFECSLDGASFTACVSPVTLTGLLDGDRVFQVRAVDFFGVVDPSPEQVDWMVDVPPVVQILSGPAAIDTQQTATFTFIANESVSGFECRLDGGSFEDCESPKQYIDLLGGSHVFEVRALDDDEFGQIGALTSFNWDVLDVVDPQTIIQVGPPSVTNEAAADFEFLCSELGCTFECNFNGTGWANCPVTHSVVAVTDGGQELEVRAVDFVGNVDGIPAIHSWLVDFTVPNITIVTAPELYTPDVNAIIAFSTDKPATLECQFQDGAFVPCTSPQIFNGQNFGVYTLKIRATGISGNTNPNDTEIIWEVVDPNAPQTIITQQPPEVVVGDEEITIAFEGTNVDHFECNSNVFEPVWQECTSPLVFDRNTADTPLPQGVYVIQIAAFNAMGVSDPTPPSVGWFLRTDEVPPQTTFSEVPPDPNTSRLAVFKYEADENVVFSCSLDSAPYEICSNIGTSFTITEPGEHILLVRALDFGLNQELVPAEHRWTYVPPVDPNSPAYAAVSSLLDAETNPFDLLWDDGVLKGPVRNAKFSVTGTGTNIPIGPIYSECTQTSPVLFDPGSVLIDVETFPNPTTLFAVEDAALSDLIVGSFTDSITVTGRLFAHRSLGLPSSGFPVDGFRAVYWTTITNIDSLTMITTSTVVAVTNTVCEVPATGVGVACDYLAENIDIKIPVNGLIQDGLWSVAVTASIVELAAGSEIELDRAEITFDLLVDLSAPTIDLISPLEKSTFALETTEVSGLLQICDIGGDVVAGLEQNAIEVFVGHATASIELISGNLVKFSAAGLTIDNQVYIVSKARDNAGNLVEKQNILFTLSSTDRTLLSKSTQIIDELSLALGIADVTSTIRLERPFVSPAPGAMTDLGRRRYVFNQYTEDAFLIQGAALDIVIDQSQLYFMTSSLEFHPEKLVAAKTISRRSAEQTAWNFLLEQEIVNPSESATFDSRKNAEVTSAAGDLRRIWRVMRQAELDELPVDLSIDAVTGGVINFDVPILFRHPLIAPTPTPTIRVYDRGGAFTDSRFLNDTAAQTLETQSARASNPIYAIPIMPGQVYAGVPPFGAPAVGPGNALLDQLSAYYWITELNSDIRARRGTRYYLGWTDPRQIRVSHGFSGACISGPNQLECTRCNSSSCTMFLDLGVPTAAGTTHEFTHAWLSSQPNFNGDLALGSGDTGRRIQEGMADYMECAHQLDVMSTSASPTHCSVGSARTLPVPGPNQHFPGHMLETALEDVFFNATSNYFIDSVPYERAFRPGIGIIQNITSHPIDLLAGGVLTDIVFMINSSNTFIRLIGGANNYGDAVISDLQYWFQYRGMPLGNYARFPADHSQNRMIGHTVSGGWSGLNSQPESMPLSPRTFSIVGNVDSTTRYELHMWYDNGSQKKWCGSVLRNNAQLDTHPDVVGVSRPWLATATILSSGADFQEALENCLNAAPAGDIQIYFTSELQSAGISPFSSHIIGGGSSGFNFAGPPFLRIKNNKKVFPPTDPGANIFLLLLEFILGAIFAGIELGFGVLELAANIFSVGIQLGVNVISLIINIVSFSAILSCTVVLPIAASTARIASICFLLVASLIGHKVILRKRNRKKHGFSDD